MPTLFLHLNILKTPHIQYVPNTMHNPCPQVSGVYFIICHFLISFMRQSPCLFLTFKVPMKRCQNSKHDKLKKINNYIYQCGTADKDVMLIDDSQTADFSKLTVKARS